MWWWSTLLQNGVFESRSWTGWVMCIQSTVSPTVHLHYITYRCPRTNGNELVASFIAQELSGGEKMPKVWIYSPKGGTLWPESPFLSINTTIPPIDKVYPERVYPVSEILHIIRKLYPYPKKVYPILKIVYPTDILSIRKVYPIIRIVYPIIRKVYPVSEIN